MDKIILNTPVLDKYTNTFKQIEHDLLQIRSNLEMLQRVRIVFYENVNGQPGRPMLEAIKADFESGLITEQYYHRAADIFKTRFYEADTAGCFVNSETGERVFQDPETGEYPHGSIPELMFWQNLPDGIFTGNNDAARIYNGILYSMAKMVERERI